MNLSQLKPGESGTISGFVSDMHEEKLMEMGFLPGEVVTVKNQAPFGGPFLVSLQGSLVGLRVNEASEIVLEK